MDEQKDFLFIINDAPYGIERPYNALRLEISYALARDNKHRMVTTTWNEW
jgi:hypothetical protein